MKEIIEKMNREKGIASAPGRVCLAGEFLDWMTGPSIMCAVDLKITAEATHFSEGDGEISILSGEPYSIAETMPFSQLGKYDGGTLDFVKASYKVFSDYISEKPSVQLRITSNLPAEGGLSSSAAVTLATISALADLFKLDMSIETLCQLSYKVEAQELETGAGQMDYYSCTRGKMMYINCSVIPPNPIEVYVPPQDICFVVVDTLTPRHARDVMRVKRKDYYSKHPLILEYISKAEPAVFQLREYMKEMPQSLEKIGEIITNCHFLDRDYLGISTDLLDRCVELANKEGALGAKLTGAGTGGCMFAMVRKSHAEKIANALRTLPVKVQVAEPSINGIECFGLMP